MSKVGYYKYLDGYRFIAACFVIATHWLPSYLVNIPLAKMGVDMFFVLSGFLITEILLKQKKELNNGEHVSKRKVLISFYIRRSLRIFPIYYLVVIFLFSIGLPIVREYISHFLLYLTNLVVIEEKDWIGMVGHLWSLAIEEQFYIFWPILILSVPLKYLDKVIVSTILLSALYVLLVKDWFYYYTILSCISTLAMGALLAFLKVSKSKLDKLKLYEFFLLFGALICFLLLPADPIKGFLLKQLCIMVFSFYSIRYLVTTSSRLLDVTLGSTIISFLGKVSYGLYLYHNFIPWLLRNMNGTEKEFIFISHPFLPEATGGFMMLLSNSLLLIAITLLSWWFIEKPINSLKPYFQYKSQSSVNKNVALIKP